MLFEFKCDNGVPLQAEKMSVVGARKGLPPSRMPLCELSDIGVAGNWGRSSGGDNMESCGPGSLQSIRFENNVA